MTSMAYPQKFTESYEHAIHALCEVATAKHSLGRMGEAHQIARICMQLSEAGEEVQPLDRLKALLLYAKILVDDHLLTNADAHLMFSTLDKAKQIAEALHDQQSLADVLSLIGQGQFFAILNTSSILGENPSGQLGDLLGLQRKALDIREAIQDTRGMSESHFYIGQIRERLHHMEQAVKHHETALQLAERHGHFIERTEPTRHLAFLSLQSGNLDQALTHALQALSYREESGFQPYLPLDHRLVCDICMKKGSLDEAWYHAKKAVSISEGMEYKGSLASSLLGVGDVYTARNEISQARECYEQSLTLAQGLDHALFTSLASGRLERISNQ